MNCAPPTKVKNIYRCDITKFVSPRPFLSSDFTHNDVPFHLFNFFRYTILAKYRKRKGTQYSWKYRKGTNIISEISRQDEKSWKCVLVRDIWYCRLCLDSGYHIAVPIQIKWDQNVMNDGRSVWVQYEILFRLQSLALSFNIFSSKEAPENRNEKSQ